VGHDVIVDRPAREFNAVDAQGLTLLGQALARMVHEGGLQRVYLRGGLVWVRQAWRAPSFNPLV